MRLKHEGQDLFDLNHLMEVGSLQYNRLTMLAVVRNQLAVGLALIDFYYMGMLTLSQ